MILPALILIFSVVQASNTGEKLRKTTFKDVTKTSEFIDKSLLIKFILDNHWHIYIMAPPGFGRTTNLRMLQEFFSVEVDSKGFFINAKKILQGDENFQDILQKRSGPRNTSTKRVTLETDAKSKSVHESDPEPLSASTNSLTNYDTFSKPPLRILKEAPELFEIHFARHPVLFMDFGKLSTKSYDDYVRTFQIMVAKLFDQFKYLLKSHRLTKGNKDEYLRFRDQVIKLGLDEVAHGGEKLAQLFSAHHHRKAIVLVDNFDKPICEALLAPHLDLKSYRGIVWSISMGKKKEFVSRIVF